MNNSITIIGKVRQRLGKTYIHSEDRHIQSVIIDALANAGYDVDVEVTNNGTNEVVSCEIYDVGGAVRKTMIKNNRTAMNAYKKITEFFDEIKSNICDNYCKYPSEIKDYDELIETVCSKCPLRKLN